MPLAIKADCELGHKFFISKPRAVGWEHVMEVIETDWLKVLQNYDHGLKSDYFAKIDNETLII